MENTRGKVCMSIQELGKALGICRQRAYDLANSEGFPAVRIGRRLVIPVSALEKWLNDHTGAGNVLPD